MIEALLTDVQRELRDEVRDFVKSVPRQLVLDMDADKVRYPREFVPEAARRNLLGLRFPAEYGGRGLKWEDEIIALEEVGVLGTALGCAYAMPSIVGEALNVFGTVEQKERWLRPLLSGELISAEALTEPRGGSDFFGTTTLARRDGDSYVLNGQKRFIVGAAEADFFLVYARTNLDASSHESISAFIVERGPGVEVEHLYGLMGTRGGGTGRLVFRDARVPMENIIGREHGAADVFYQMMIPERMTSAAAACWASHVAWGCGREWIQRSTPGPSKENDSRNTPPTSIQGCRRPVGAYLRGRCTANVLPSPETLWTVTSPPWARANSRAMDRPSPTPPSSRLRARSTR
jgi:alkylation response protein AidB-like acyl-CoA dehydrogenase